VVSTDVVDNFIAEASIDEPEARGPQVELEAQASEDVPEVVAAEEEEAAEDTKPEVVKKPTKPSKSPKGRLSLLARLRQRSRPHRS